MVEALEVLPRRLASIDDGVWTWWPVVRLRTYLHVDAVEHRLDPDNHGVKFPPLGSGL